MEIKTVRQVSKDYGVSNRMLCYYEEIGLLKSSRKDDYAYRVYDEDAIRRLQQIIILRKLQIPMKQIKDILGNQSAVEVIEIFEQNMSEIDEQITALSAIKTIIARFVDEMKKRADIHLKLDLLNDKTMLAAVSSLSFSENKINKINDVKGKLSMEELNKASENLNKFEDKDIRIIYLPPMTVAAAIGLGEGSEGKALGMITKFVQETDLLKIKPDARSFGFDFSEGESKMGEPSKVYEVWVAVPDDMEIPAPLVKRNFSGGQYAAHVLRNWDFSDWGRLAEWVNTSAKYTNDVNTPRGGDTKITGQGLEETLDFYNYIQKGGKAIEGLDLLFPIKEKA
ncbi:MAG: effector binding domain-containing protein [Oscillospiraceae bacterium]|nr:effector binding domain-containing protein [Oscillospiraceae bacterium]